MTTIAAEEEAAAIAWQRQHTTHPSWCVAHASGHGSGSGQHVFAAFKAGGLTVDLVAVDEEEPEVRVIVGSGDDLYLSPADAEPFAEALREAADLLRQQAACAPETVPARPRVSIESFYSVGEDGHAVALEQLRDPAELLKTLKVRHGVYGTSDTPVIVIPDEECDLPSRYLGTVGLPPDDKHLATIGRSFAA